MKQYIELPVECIELDKSNPRIARGVAFYGENISSDTMALLLGSTSEASAIVKRLLRLVQATSNPHLVDESFHGRSSKEAVLDLLIRQILSAGEKCIVWTNFIENVDYFNKAYSEYGCVKIHGGMNMADRNRSVERFRTDEYKILFATPASAKEGLTLTMANHVIFYDRGFSLDDYLQAQDRIHRISQKKTCYVHNIIMKDSILCRSNT